MTSLSITNLRERFLRWRLRGQTGGLLAASLFGRAHLNAGGTHIIYKHEFLFVLCPNTPSEIRPHRILYIAV